MSRVYNSIGSLTTIKSHLRSHNVNDFNSLKELINFQKNYSAAKQQIILNHSHLIEQEKGTLNEEIVQLNAFVEIRKYEVEQQLQLELDILRERLNSLPANYSSVFQRLIDYFKKTRIKREIRSKERNFNSKIKHSVEQLTTILAKKCNRCEYIISSFQEAVNESSFTFIKRTFWSFTGLGVLGGLYTWQIEPFWLEFVRLKMPVKNLPDGLVGKTLMQISDIHVGKRFNVRPEITIFEL